MAILMKKIYRDIRKNKGRSISIILIVAIATSLYGGLLLSLKNIEQTFDDLEDTAKIESVRFIVDDIAPSLINLDTIDGIELWDTRLNILTGIVLANDDTIYIGVLYGIDPSQEPRVNGFQYIDGGLFTTNSILLNSQFMDSRNLAIGDSIFILTGDQFVTVPIEASIFSPEFIYNVNPVTGLPDVTGLAAGWLPLPYLQSIFDTGNVVNEVVVRFDDVITEDLVDDKISEISSYLRQFSNEVSYVKLDHELEQEMKNADVGAIDDTARVFGLVILLLALFTIYDNISKLIANQRNIIGTMRALGGSKWRITRHYTSIGIILGSMGILLGIPLGWVISYFMTVGYAGILGFPTPSTAFAIEAFYEAILANFFLISVLSLYASLSTARIEPREAMASSFVSTSFHKKPFFEKLLTKLPGLKTPTAKIPIRNLFRFKKKTIITLFTYSISLMIMLSAMAFMDSFFLGIDENYEKYEKYDMQVHLLEPMLPSEIEVQLQKVSKISAIEFFTSTIVELNVDGISQSVGIMGYQANSTLRKFNLGSGENAYGLVIGANLASRLNVKTGDKVSMFGSSVTIQGIDSSLTADGAYLPLTQLQSYLGIQANVTGILLKMENGWDVSDAKFSLIKSGLPVATIIATSEVKDSIEVLIQGMMAIIGVMVFIGFITVALFSFNTIVLDVMSRENEFINIRSLGGGRMKVLKIITLQGLFVSIIGSLISIPIGYYLTDWMIGEMISDLMILPTYISLQTYVIAILSAFSASLVGIFAAIRHVMKIDLADALRTRVSN